MSDPKLTLISHPLCPFVQRVAIVLREKQMPFEQIHVDLRNKPDWFLAISPTGKVPLLKRQQEGGEEAVIFESVVICEFLEDTHRKPAMHPSDPLRRAQHRAWVELSSAMLSDAWGYLNAADGAVATVKASHFRTKLERFEAEMPDGPYFAGRHFSMVDAAAAPVFRYFDVLRHDVTHPVFSGLQRVSRWRQALAERPSVQQAVVLDYADRFRSHLKEHGALLASA